MAAHSGPGLTEQQRRAVETRDVSIALSAGAGCGKTHVLVERYLSHLAPGGADEAAPMAGLIAITFTDRAAREMRERVRRKCRERLQHAAGEEEAAAWLKLLRELETARVSTIHSFCGSLLRSHAVEAGIDPRFQVLQPGQAATLFAEQMDDQLRAQLGERNEDLLNLIVMFGLPRVREMVQHLLGRRHDIDFDVWTDVTPDDLVARWRKVEREQVLPLVREEFLALPQVEDIGKIMAGWTPTNQVMCERFGALTIAFAALAESDDLLGLLTAIRENAKVQGGGSAKQWHSLEVYDQFRDAASALRDWIDKKVDRLGIAVAASRESAAAGLALLRVAEPIIAAYEAHKREMSMLDFNDMLIQARDLLQGPHGPDLRKQLSSRLVLLLVDEFQDTDPLQVQLVEVLCGDQLEQGKLFFVGDAKQSIYRFRGADPRVFRQLRERIPQEGRLPLTKNFRSQPAVLDFVNALFCDRLGPAYEALHADRTPLTDQPAIEFLWATLGDDNTQKPTAELLRRQEADWIARRLAGMFAAGDMLIHDRSKNETRPAAAGDVTILFRALSDVQYYEEALRHYSIPYYLVGGAAFYAQQEVFDLLNLLRTLEAPHDLVSLTGVLRSPFFSLADETLFWLAQHANGLAAGLFATRLPSQLDEAQRGRAQFAAETLVYLRARKDRLPIARLIREALERTGYDALLVAEFLGERKLANLRKLVDHARSFDQSGIFTLADFIHELAEFVSQQPDEPLAPVELESSTVVRLMTIHQAKGLEFPVVVVPDLSRSPGGMRGAMAFSRELGPLLRANLGPDETGPCGLDLYRMLDEQEEADEEIRLLYVATTRAADHLILSAGLRDIEKPTGGWLELLASRFELRTGEFKAKLPAGYARPQVTVTLSQPDVPSGVIQGTSRVDLAAVAAATRDCVVNGGGHAPRIVEPVTPDLAARRVFSFSRLAGNFAKNDAALQDPLLRETPAAETLSADQESDATELGTLVHAVLAQIDFSGKDDVAARCRREQSRHFAATTTEPATAITLIERFLQSSRAAALRTAQVVHRELEFLLAWPPGQPRQGRMIQGFIDCLYQDRSGDWHLVDYKTNRVAADSVPQAAQAYELQMSLYALAVEEVLGRSPASLVLHFLQPGVEHVCVWNHETREWTITMIDNALAAYGTPSTNHSRS
ncbi:MAG TPA: UvrD-helicase domain-containing protein [Pirellulales bacterium]|jgi:ATP-dependent helicase/nuclease subunit A